MNDPRYIAAKPTLDQIGDLMEEISIPPSVGRWIMALLVGGVVNPVEVEEMWEQMERLHRKIEDRD